MKKFGIPGVLFIVIMLLYGCARPEAGESSEVVAREYPVKVQPVKKESITRSLDYTANLTAFEEVYFAPASPGRIEKIHVDVGDPVSSGQVLLEMDRTQLQQAMIQLQNARSNFLRVDTLYRLESISEQQYEQVKTQYEVARSNVDFLRENTSLLSPISGIVTERYYEPREMFSGAPNTEAGKAAVFRIMQIDPLKVFVSISERYFPEIRKDMKATIRLDMYPGKTFTGKVYRVHPTVDETTRTFLTEIMINNPGKKLRPGMFARVNLELEQEEAITVPAVSVMQQEGTNNRFIFVNNDGSARKINVELGQRFDDKLEIRSDYLEEGMQLVVAGQASLEDGARLKVVGE